MKYCSKCGKAATNDEAVCPFCGEPFPEGNIPYESKSHKMVGYKPIRTPFFAIAFAASIEASVTMFIGFIIALYSSAFLGGGLLSSGIAASILALVFAIICFVSKKQACYSIGYALIGMILTIVSIIPSLVAYIVTEGFVNSGMMTSANYSLFLSMGIIGIVISIAASITLIISFRKRFE